MTELFAIIVSTVLVNNLVLIKFLGLCPFLGVTRTLESAIAMALATTFVLTLSSALTHMVYHWVLLPLDLGFLKLIAFILMIAIAVQLTDIFVRRSNPLLHQLLGIYLPLVASNCAILGVALLNITQSHNFLQSLFFGFGTAMGFTFVLVTFAGLRERLEASDIPLPFKGAAIAFITLGLMSLAFLGFRGLVRL